MKRVGAVACLFLFGVCVAWSQPRQVLVEHFELPKTALIDTLFPHFYVWQGNTYILDALAPGVGAPSFNPPLPINEGGDQEVRLVSSYYAGGHGFALMADAASNYFGDVVLDAYVGVGTVTPWPYNPPRAGLVVRHVGPAFGASAASAMVSEDGAGNAWLSIHRWAGGTGYPAVSSRGFPALGTSGCYRIRFGAVSNLFFASLWAVRPGPRGPQETPIDLSDAAGLQPVLSCFDAGPSTGRVGMIGAATRSNSTFYDDIRVVVSPGADIGVRTWGRSQARVGQVVTYLTVVWNCGPDDAPNVGVSQRLPDSVSPLWASAPCVIQGQQVLGVIPLVAAGETRSLLVCARAVTPGRPCETVVTAGSPMRDPREANNADTCTLRVVKR